MHGGVGSTSIGRTVVRRLLSPGQNYQAGIAGTLPSNIPYYLASRNGMVSKNELALE